VKDWQFINGAGLTFGEDALPLKGCSIKQQPLFILSKEGVRKKRQGGK